MEQLDDDSLICVFNELDFLQKIPLESVCGRWARILRSQAPYRKMQTVNIGDYAAQQQQQKKNKEGTGWDGHYKVGKWARPFWPPADGCKNLSDKFLHEYVQRKYYGSANVTSSLTYQATICGVIDRAGPHIRELDLGHRWPRIAQQIIGQLAQKCHNLTKLDMGWVRLEADISPLLEQIDTQLVDFSLEETSWADAENAEKVSRHLPKMKMLKRLNLRKFDEPLDELALLDSGTMEFLDVSECTQLSAEILVQFFERNPQLLVLHLCPMPFSCLPLIAMSTTSAINLPGPFLGFVRPRKQTGRRCYIDEDGKLMRKAKNKRQNGSTDLQVLINKFGTLKRLRTLWFGHIPYSAHFLSLKALAELSELRHLHIKECNSLDANALDFILKGISATLRQLSLLKCDQLESYGALPICQTLTQLDIEKGNCLKNADLQALAVHGNLRLLRLKECPCITCESVWSVVDNCQSLKEMELIKCSGLSDNLFSNGHAFAKLLNLQRLSLCGCETISRHSILEAVHVLNWDALTQLDLGKNMDIDESILRPIWEQLNARKGNRKKCLTLHVGGTGIMRESDQTKFEPQIELMF